MKHIVVIGGGFAGINFVCNLRENQDFQITLVDRNNYNFFLRYCFKLQRVSLSPLISPILSGDYLDAQMCGSGLVNLKK